MWGGGSLLTEEHVRPQIGGQTGWLEGCDERGPGFSDDQRSAVRATSVCALVRGGALNR